MNVGFSGSRPPIRGFTLGEQELAEEQTADLVRGTRVGTGGNAGIDEIVMQAAREGGLYVVTFLPAEQYRDQTSQLVERLSHEIRNTGKDLMGRNHDLAEWASTVRALPLYEEERSPRSGTWATIRMAMRGQKLERVVILRPRGGRDPIVLVPRGGVLVPGQASAI